jgi:flagellin-like hook-associated protein FlgL
VRVATSTIFDNANYAIQLAQVRLVRAQTEVASGTRLQTAADGPGDSRS